MRQIISTGSSKASELIMDEVLGVYPCEEVESAMLAQEQTSAPCAARLVWQKGTRIDGSSKDKKDLVSCTIGRLSICYPAGLATDLKLFVCEANPSGCFLDNRADN